MSPEERRMAIGAQAAAEKAEALGQASRRRAVMRLQGVLDRDRGNSLRGLVRLWRTAVKDRVERLGAQQGAIRRTARVLRALWWSDVRMALLQWADHWRAFRHLRAEEADDRLVAKMSSSAIEVWDMRLLALAYNRWRQCHLLLSRRRERASKALQRARLRLLRTAWEHWHSRTDFAGCTKPVRVRLVVQDRGLRDGVLPGRWVHKGEQYGIALAKVPQGQAASYEAVSQAQTTIEAGSMSGTACRTPRSLSLLKIEIRKEISPLRLRGGQALQLIKATESTLCVAWGTGPDCTPHTLYIAPVPADASPHVPEAASAATPSGGSPRKVPTPRGGTPRTPRAAVTTPRGGTTPRGAVTPLLRIPPAGGGVTPVTPRARQTPRGKVTPRGRATPGGGPIHVAPYTSTSTSRTSTPRVAQRASEGTIRTPVGTPRTPVGTPRSSNPQQGSLAFQAMAVLDPQADSSEGQFCYVLTHLSAGQRYCLRVDIGTHRNVCENEFSTLKSTKSPRRPSLAFCR